MTFTLDFESGVNGDAATAGPGNTGFDSLLAGAGTMVISTAQKFAGTRSLLCTATSTNSTLCGVKALTAGVTSITVDDYRYYTVLPSAQVDFLRVLDTAAAQAFGANVDATGRLRLGNSSGATITGSASATGLFVVNQWMHTKIDADTSGNIRVRVYVGASSTASFDSGTLIGQSIGASFATLRVGAKAGTSTATATVYVDAVSVTDNAATTPVVANPGANQSALEPWAAIAVAGSASGGSGGPYTFAWTQESGPAAVLTNTTAATVTVEPPGTLNGTNVVLGLVARDAAGTASPKATVTLGVSPAPDRVIRGGVQLVVRRRNVRVP